MLLLFSQCFITLFFFPARRSEPAIQSLGLGVSPWTQKASGQPLSKCPAAPKFRRLGVYGLTWPRASRESTARRDFPTCSLNVFHPFPIFPPHPFFPPSIFSPVNQLVPNCFPKPFHNFLPTFSPTNLFPRPSQPFPNFLPTFSPTMFSPRPFFLSLPGPFFSAIVLFKNQLFPRVFGGFLERRIPGKNGEAAPTWSLHDPRKRGNKIVILGNDPILKGPEDSRYKPFPTPSPYLGGSQPSGSLAFPPFSL